MAAIRVIVLANILLLTLEQYFLAALRVLQLESGALVLVAPTRRLVLLAEQELNQEQPILVLVVHAQLVLKADLAPVLALPMVLLAERLESGVLVLVALGPLIAIIVHQEPNQEQLILVLVVHV
jgi:hypothetical protein